MATNVTTLNSVSNILPGSVSSLVLTNNQTRKYGVNGDYVEMNVYDLNNNFIFQIVPFLNFRIPGNYPAETETYTQELDFSPGEDAQQNSLGFGTYIFEYNILRPKIINDIGKIFFIKEISANRTELRLGTNSSVPTLTNGTLSFINEFQSLGYFKEFYINLGNGNLLPCVNIALDENTDPPTLLIKLLNPLPGNFNTLATLNIVDKISDSKLFQVGITPDVIEPTYPSLRGANFNIELDNVRANPTQYFSLNQITDSKSSVNSQLQSLLGLVSSSQFNINVDYTNLSNFIHYSSAVNRLDGFKYKLSLIETYTAASSSAATLTTSAAQQDAQNYQKQLNKVIQGFDGYEKYLYYESSSYAWPKQNSIKPYINYASTSSQGIQWYSGSYDSASLYDINNQNYLIYALPTYINENSSNNNLFKYVSSIGLMFDEIWLYTKAITDLYQSKNSLTEGISKDLVYFALQSMGVNVYPDQDGENIFQYLYGVTPDGKYLPNTSSYETLITASQYSMPGQDQEKGIYKRLYHNLPLLLKSKGTNRFIQYLNTIFGIPTTVMGYTEYGGVDKSTVTTEYEFDRFTYGLNINSPTYDSRIEIPWTYLSQSLDKTGNNDVTADAIELRIKMTSLPYNDFVLTQSIFSIQDNTTNDYISVDVHYTQTGSSNSIYSGSVGNFGYLNLYANVGGSITGVNTSTIPLFTTGSNGETSWYNILLQRRVPNQRANESGNLQHYDLYIKNNVYGEVGHVASASLSTNDTNINDIWFYGENRTFKIPGVLEGFSGSIQELRFWSNTLSESKFDIHVLNPESIEGNTTGSSFDDLAVRFTLGNNLYTYDHSVTTEIYSTHPDQNTQVLTASFIGFPDLLNINSYLPFTETYYANTANSGYANPVNDKVRIISGSTYGTQLLPNKSIVVQPLLPTTKDIHLLDASLSPQDEIDRDIIASLGATYTIDDYIGDPSGNNLVNLNKLRFDHFKKYKKPFNYKDYIRLIEFFHTSLFRTLKDFIPARTNVATGMVIKPNILERSTHQIIDPGLSQHNNRTSSIDTLFITSSNGGGYTQPTYNYTINSNLGPVTQISDGRDFFTGELPSSSIFIHDDFDIANYNPYAIGFKSDNTGSYSQSLWNVEFNPLLNNVEQNQISNRRKKLTLIGGNSGFVKGSNYVTESVDLQDFTYLYKRHINPRYIGTKVSSLLYNTYTSTSYTGSDFSVVSGDNSYGKTAAIDRKSYKLGWVKTILSQSLNFTDKTQIQLKYLVDKDSNITDLNQQNKNLFEVQNTFKSGDNVVVSLSDTINPSNQKRLDGTKSIFRGGFSFDPILFREDGNDLQFFKYDVTPTLIKRRSYSLLENRNIQYRINEPNSYGGAIFSSDYFADRFGQDNIETPPIYASLNDTVNHGYTIYTNNVLAQSDLLADPVQRSPYNQPSQIGLPDNIKVNGSLPATWNNGFHISITNTYDNFGGKAFSYYVLNKINFQSSTNTFLDSDNIYNDNNGSPVLFRAPRSSTYNIKANIPLLIYLLGEGNYTPLGRSYRFNKACFKIFGVLEKSSNNGGTWTYVDCTTISFEAGGNGGYLTNLELDSDYNAIRFPGSGANRSKFNLKFGTAANNNTLSVSLNTGDQLRFRLIINDIDGIFYFSTRLKIGIGSFIEFNDGLPQGSQADTFLEITDSTNDIFQYENNITVSGSTPLFTATNKNISFSQELSTLYNSGSYIPDERNRNNLYTSVNDIFSPKENDLIRFGSILSDNPQYCTVQSVSYDLPNGALTTNSFRAAAKFQTISNPGSFKIYIEFTPTSNLFFTTLNNVGGTYNLQRRAFTVSGITGNGVGNNNRTFNIANLSYGTLTNLDNISIGGNVTVNNFDRGIYCIIIDVFGPLFGNTDTRDGFSRSYPLTTFTTTEVTPFIPVLNLTTKETIQTNAGDSPQRNFAILRPKPDETSVIINFKKELGDVSQTVLIPQDANDDIINSVGNIYKNLNNDLTNQNIIL